jgi:hypothetical protein
MVSGAAKAVETAKQAALQVLLHNAHGPFQGLPRAAGWGYPEPYTRDLLISSLGILVSRDRRLLKVLRRVLEKLGLNQSPRGHIPSLVHDPEDRGASDTTPLFLIAVALYRAASGEREFLDAEVRKAKTWMEYQSPADRVLVAQLPTSDWRDEQWVVGYGLYVNTLLYLCLRLHGDHTRAALTKKMMDRFTITGGIQHRHVHEGLVVRSKPYYALWSYKVYSSERFDLVGNSLAILSGLASPSRANDLINWIEAECAAMKLRGELAFDLPPVLFPYIKEGDPDWRPRYAEFNLPGEYHNGGIWPFACGLYVAALVAAGRHRLAAEKLDSLTRLVAQAKRKEIGHGFNEWLRARDGRPAGEDWQTWSASLFLYAAECVEARTTPFLDSLRCREPAGQPGRT